VSIEVDAQPGWVSWPRAIHKIEGVEVAVKYTVRVPHCRNVEHVVHVNGRGACSGSNDVRPANGKRNIDVYERRLGAMRHTTNGTVIWSCCHVQVNRRYWPRRPRILFAGRTRRYACRPETPPAQLKLFLGASAGNLREHLSRARCPALAAAARQSRPPPAYGNVAFALGRFCGRRFSCPRV